MVSDVKVGFLETGERGLYAFRDFRQGETIVKLPSVAMQEPDMFSIQAWPGLHIDCQNSPAGAINHSCEPNAAVRKGAIIAWSCIKAGDEITIDYRKTETKIAAPFNCSCSSKFCVGRIA